MWVWFCRKKLSENPIKTRKATCGGCQTPNLNLESTLSVRTVLKDLKLSSLYPLFEKEEVDLDFLSKTSSQKKHLSFRSTWTSFSPSTTQTCEQLEWITKTSANWSSNSSATSEHLKNPRSCQWKASRHVINLTCEHVPSESCFHNCWFWLITFFHCAFIAFLIQLTSFFTPGFLQRNQRVARKKNEWKIKLWKINRE